MVDASVASWGPLAGIAAGFVAILAAAMLAARVMRLPAGNDRMREISQAVREGAMAFIRVEYRVVAVIGAILAVLFLGVGVATGEAFWTYTAIGFVTGAVLSGFAGYLGMSIAVRANARVAESARQGLASALSVSFQAGAVNGLAVVGLGILGVAGLYLALRATLPAQAVPLNLIGFAFGASLITLFARIAGGIYTKAADVGADLVGKVEAGIPEDDPRNPAVIADNVGDNVGDCAGMGADLFETYVVTIVASMALAATATVFGARVGDAALGEVGILFPLVLGAFSILSSIVGIFFVRLPASQDIMRALYHGVIATVAISAVGFYVLTVPVLGLPIQLYFASLIGLALVLALVFVTDYYTSKSFAPVKGIADASTTGPGTNIIQGLAVGLESVALPTFLIVVGLLASYALGASAGPGLGLYGIAVAATGMLSVAGMVVALDTYGPITDNAGGIAEMSELPKDVRKVTDALDAVGNTTKATTKGYAIGSAALAALVLFADFVDHASEAAIARGTLAAGTHLSFEISHPAVLAGLLLGGAVVFLFAAYAMRAVGRAAKAVVEEVRRQFADGQIMAGRRKPEYGPAVEIVTKAALREMIVPGSLAVLAPLAIGFVLGPLALGGFLIGIIVAGLMMALLMANGGGSWDNAKKLIEEGIHGGKGSDAHKAAVVGDTVGDPFKDTAGPAINPLIKVMNTIAVIFAGLVVAYQMVAF
ncbi:MAG TPA: sodium-translocating pyrophosphatase [Candidatus Thermoplasmatota archaeon]|nr:sodium-translocating pyrophosphatase [Candidatus Thermoplasmatota archaeon]